MTATTTRACLSGKSLAALVLCSAALLSISTARAQTFSDVTAAAGISYNQFSTVDLAPSDARVMSGGAAAGDYDGDGWTDLFVTRVDDQPILYRNQGNGTFSPIASGTTGINLPAGSNGATWVDVDNNGQLDLYVTTMNVGRNYLYMNNGNGTFSESAVARGVDVPNASLPQANNFSASVGDFDGDGYVDLFTTSWGDSGGLANRLLRNQGASNPGHFVDVTGSAGVAMTNVSGSTGVPGTTYGFSPRFSDLDRDGHVDIAVAADFGNSRLFWNNGDGTFTDGSDAAGIGTDENGMGSAIGDIDGDGDLDWFVTSIYDDDPNNGTWGKTGNRLYTNNGDRTFNDATDAAGVRDGGWGWGAALFDYDNDGDLDLAQTNGFRMDQVNFDDKFNDDPNLLWNNDGTGTFTEVAAAEGVLDSLLGDASGKGLLTFDYDNDGDLDYFVVNNGDQPILYRNDSDGSNDWLQIELVGSDSNSQGIGAMITLVADDGGDAQIREVNAGSHFLGQSDIRAHFGLGNLDDLISELTVQWPSGQTNTYYDLTPNQLLRIYEFDGGLVTVPEPTSLALGGMALAGLTVAAVVRRRKKKCAA
ncbi:MAG: PEP-CTERM sorting domain-containing protein [Planctomycetota bacterium]|nr:MAG: PEP-CTERM sorting domain-containing protein [Planctomycetota bacterium]